MLNLFLVLVTNDYYGVAATAVFSIINLWALLDKLNLQTRNIKTPCQLTSVMIIIMLQLLTHYHKGLINQTWY